MNIKFSLSYYLLLLFFSISFTSNAIAQNINKKIDQLIASELEKKNAPGGAFMIAKNGKIIYQKAFGKANLELDVDLTTDNIFQIGSVSKQFTAVGILILEEQGKLNIKDPISKYILDYPNGNKITIYHLLTHTSGVKDFTKIKGLKDIANKEMTPKEMVDFFKNEPVDFNPGEKFDYNNSGYVLLGYLIEIASGETYEEFIRHHIFEKAGMKNSYYNSDRAVIKKRASGYQEKNGIYVNKTIINYSVPFSSGALMSTLEDMLKWQIALNNETLLKSTNSSKAFRSYTLNDGTETQYGYGWHIRNINDVETREHGGSIFGFKSMAVYIPSEDIYVIGLTNCTCISPTKTTQDIAKLVLENNDKL